MSRERDFVLLLCRYPLTPFARARAQAMFRGACVDLPAAAAMAAAWEVEPAFFSNLSLIAKAANEIAISRDADARARDARATALKMSLITADLVNRITLAGIRVVVLKGAALAVSAYDDPSMRSFQDIDLLVPEEDIAHVREFLLRSGYARSYRADVEVELLRGGHALEFVGAGPRVEVHTMLVESYLHFNIPFTQLWRHAATVDCGGNQMKVLSNPYALVFLAAHGAKHEWSRFRWICDVAQVLGRMDERSLSSAISVATAAHGVRLLSLALELSDLIFGGLKSRFPSIQTDHPMDSAWIIKVAFENLGLADRNRGDPNEKATFRQITALLFWLRTRERWTDRFASLMSVAKSSLGLDA